MNKVQRNPLGVAVSGGVALCVLGSFWVGNMKSFFGVYIPKDTVLSISSPLSFGLLFLAYSLFRQRKNPVPARIIRTLAIYVAFALFVCGWRFVAGEVAPPLYANDGFTVTGGFMMLFAGLIAGYLFATKNVVGKE